MKNILFYYSQLNIGGAEKSLIRLMNALVKAGNKVTYLGRYSGGKGEYLLSKDVRKYWLSHPLNQNNFFLIFVGFVRAYVERKWSEFWLRHKIGDFDIAFIGLQGLSPELIIKNVKASKICIFIRSDISKAKQKTKIIENLRGYISEIDYYICVAGSVRDSLIKEIPEAESKAIVVYNTLGVEEMKRQMMECENPFADEDESVFRMVTVCRMSDSSKALFRMVRVCRRLVDEGFTFRWYVVGDGPDLSAFRQSIEDYGLNDVMITPGRINNPFGYYRDCNLVAMLSYYEGLCGVVNESKVAGKAIIATEVSGIHEQLEHGKNGWIVDNDEDAIFKGLRHLLNNPETVKALTNTIYPEILLDDEAKISRICKLANNDRV